jgi:hypothetical protein
VQVFTVPNVFVANGDSVLIAGTGQGAANARVDKIVFVRK